MVSQKLHVIMHVRIHTRILASFTEVIYLRMCGWTLMFLSFCCKGLWGTESIAFIAVKEHTADI